MSQAAHQQQRYRVLERLASGGMAEVFIAESAGIEGFKKRVAIKRVLPNLSEKRRFIAMFLDEARLSAQLSHSNVVQVFDIGVGDNAYFIVMEYVDGADLKAVIEYMKRSGRAFPVEAAVYLAQKICEGLAYAHEATSPDGVHLKIVHRDMSPPNVLITKHGEVKIVDFGLAKASSQLEKSEAGIIKGKFSYLAPEAALGGDVDHRVDVFAVGIILWEMLSGRKLFQGDTDFQTVKLVQQAVVPPLSEINRAVPPELDRILARALARDMGQRYATARDFGRDLTSFLYRYGRPVGAYDIAELVRGAMGLRKKAAPERASLIDKLIEEALFEFTSLQDDKAPPPAPVRTEEPLKLSGYEDISGWADELAAQPNASSISGSRAQLSGINVEEGNLAALEEDDEPADGPTLMLAPGTELLPSSLRSAARADVAPVPPPPRSSPMAPAVPMAAPPPVDSAALAPVSSALPVKGGGGGAVKAAVVVAVLALAAVGAYLGGVFGR
jgi:serine/threonine protein kinase